MNFKLSIKKRGKKGDGRAVHFKPVQVPEDVFEDLKLYKNIYEMTLSKKADEHGCPIPQTVSFGEMLRHWMENVSVFDPEIQRQVDKVWEDRKKYSHPTYFVDPADGPIWEMTYVFEKDGEEVEAMPDEDSLFYAILDDEKIEMKELDQQGWTLMNEAGIEIDIIQAVKVSKILLQHSK